MALVCKSWNAIAFEFLYSSILINSDSHCAKFIRLTLLPKVARCILRVTITTSNLCQSDGMDDICLYGLQLCEIWPVTNTKLTQFDYDLLIDCCVMPSDTGHSILGLLFSVTSSLKTLRLTKLGKDFMRASTLPPSLPNLQELEMDFIELDDFKIGEAGTEILSWLTNCKLPSLNTVILNARDQSTQTLITFGKQLVTIGLDGTPCRIPSSGFLRIPMPKLQTFIAKHYFARNDWNGLLDTVDLTGVEKVEILFSHEMPGMNCMVLGELQWFEDTMGHNLTVLLDQWNDRFSTPLLSTVVFDLGPNMRDKIWRDGLRSTLRCWFERFHSLRPSVQVCAAHYDGLTANLVSIPLDSLLNRADDISESIRLIKQDRN